MKTKTIADRLVPLIIPVTLVLTYHLYSQKTSSMYFPTISEIWQASKNVWFGEGFMRHVVPSLENLAVGYLAGFFIGLVVGVVIGQNFVTRGILQPLIYFGLTIPGIALLPVFLIIFGVSPFMQKALIATSIFFLTVINTSSGIQNIDPLLGDVSSVYRIRNWRKQLLIILPAASVQILAAAKIGVSLALLVMVVAEFVGASRGIGAITLVAQQGFDYASMWSGIVFLAFLGIILNALFNWGEKHVVKSLNLDFDSK